jgi:hypothetical protein
MANQKIVLAQLDLDVSALIKATAEAEKAVGKLKARLAELKAAGQDTTAGFAKLQYQLKQLTAVLEDQQKAVKELRKKNDDLAESQKDAAKAAKKQMEAQNDLSDSIDDVSDAATRLKNTATAAGSAVGALGQAAGASAGGVAELNTALTKQAELTAKADEGNKKTVTTFNDYKKQVADSFESINILNGGLGGLISRSQEAGGAGALLKEAFAGMSSGIVGMTKSAMGFIATPFGVVLAAISVALGAVISYFKDSQEGIDKLTAVTRPLQAVFSALGVLFQNVGKIIANVFSNPMESLEAFGTALKENLTNRITGLLELVPNLGKAVGLLFEGKFSEAGKVAADAMGKVALGTDNITDKVAGAAKETGAFLQQAWDRGQQIDQLQKQLDKNLDDYTKKNSDLGIELEKQNSIADDSNASYAEREAAATKAITLQQEQNKLVLNRMDTEIKLLKLKQEENGLTNAENNEMAELTAKRAETAAQQVAGEKATQGKIDSLRQEAHDKEIARRQKLLDDAITKQKQQLDLFTAQGDSKAKTLKEELAFETEKAAMSMAILKKELDAKQITQLQYNKGALDIEQQQLKNLAQINTNYSLAALNLWKEENKSKLKQGELLTEDTAAEEKIRLENLKAKLLEQLDLETHLNAEVVIAKRGRNEELTQEEVNYLTSLQQINTEMQAQDEAVTKQLDDDKKTKKQQDRDTEAANRALDFELQHTEATTQYENDLLEEEERYQTEKASLIARRDDELITKEQFAILEKALDEETAKNKQRLAIQNMQTQLGTMQSVAGALGDAFGQSKELALAQATMNAGQAILSIWSGTISGNPVVDTVIKGVLTAATAVKTAKQIKDIQSAKKPKQPKFAQGGLVSVGGSRHSNGGTLFTGADGTRFEAEQGELIGVMNRNAAAHFMAFNNAFPAGGSNAAPNYFASGGIVSREMAAPGLNIDELAAKIAAANAAIPAPVVAVQDIITQGNSYVQVRDAANF